MKFDNSLQPSSGTWAAVKDHLPIVMLIGGLAFLFVGLHTAASGLVALAAVHVAGATVVFGLRHFRQSRSGTQTATQSETQSETHS